MTRRLPSVQRPGAGQSSTGRPSKMGGTLDRRHAMFSKRGYQSLRPRRINHDATLCMLWLPGWLQRLLTMVALIRHAASLTPYLCATKRISAFLPPTVAASSPLSRYFTNFRSTPFRGGPDPECRASSSSSHTMMSTSAGSLEVAQFLCLSDNYG